MHYELSLDGDQNEAMRFIQVVLNGEARDQFGDAKAAAVAQRHLGPVYVLLVMFEAELSKALGDSQAAHILQPAIEVHRSTAPPVTRRKFPE